MDFSAQWDLSCPDWEDKIRAGVPLLPDGLEDMLFQDEAQIAVNFFNDLILPNVPGTPTMKEGCGPWFRESFIRPLFGSRDPKTNIRYIPEIFGMVGKGNSKTTYSAGLMLTALLMNLRPRAEFYFIGETQAIADLAFGQAEGMIEGNRELDNRFKIIGHEKEIVDRVNKARR
jgi:phage terminase large subunit-like protein